MQSIFFAACTVIACKWRADWLVRSLDKGVAGNSKDIALKDRV